MLNIINKLLKYFGYEIQPKSTIDTWLKDINTKAKIIWARDDRINQQDEYISNELDSYRSINTELNKTITAYKHQIDNQRVLIEEQIESISKLNSQTVEQANDNSILIDTIRSLEKELKQRVSDMNKLRSNVASSYKSRDQWKSKYKQLVWKLALDKCCNKK